MNTRHLKWSVACLLLILSCGEAPDRTGKAARNHLFACYIDILSHDAAATPQDAVSDSLTVDTLRHAADPETIRAAIRYLNERPERWNRFFNETLRALNVTVTDADSAAAPSFLRRSRLNRSAATVPR